MTSIQEIVTYDGLPASAGGAHSLRAKDPRRAFGKVQAFVDAVGLIHGAPEISFRLWAGGPPDIAARIESFAAEQFGGRQSQQRTHSQWRVRPESVDATLEVVAAAGSEAVTAHGHPLASLVWNARVTLVDPVTRLPYEGIDADSFGRFAADGYGRILGESGVRGTFGTTASSLSLWLGLPADDRLHGAAVHVREHLPFRLSTKHWRRWSPTKDGRSFRSAKISSPLLP